MFDKLIEFLINIIDRILPFYVIHQYQEAVLYRGGRLIGPVKPGLHWKIPLLDTYSEDIVTIDTMRIEEVNVTTLDGKTVTVGCEFDVWIIDIVKAMNDTHDWRSNLKDIARGILSDQLEDKNWEDIKKKTTKNAIERKINERAAEIGSAIGNFNFTDKLITRAFKLFNNYYG